jgi:capsular polysaccharide transport system permease protein
MEPAKMDKEGSAVRPDASLSRETDTDESGSASAGKGPATDVNAVFSFSSRRATTDSSTPQIIEGRAEPALKAVPSPTDLPVPVEQPLRKPAKPPGKPNGPKQGQQKGPKQGQGKGQKGKRGQGAPVKPIAQPAQMKKRHWGIIISFLALVVIPLIAALSYLIVVAKPQYHSISGFTVRSQEESGASDLLGGLTQLAGGSVASDNDIIYEFIRSQEMVQAVDERLDLRSHYTQHWPDDWFFALWEDASLEDLLWYWNRVVGVSFDQGTGLIEVQTKAFDAETAQALNQAIVDVSLERINDLNLVARREAMQYARTDLEEALEQLKAAREALTNYRTQSQIVDPELDIQTRMGVMNSLQQELASALVEYDLLLGSTSGNDPRLRDTSQRIEVIRDRIAIERQNIASSSTETGGVELDYPTLIAEFERLTVDREYAEQYYFASLTAMEVARDDANRSSRYLATYIQPTISETPEYPNIPVTGGLAAFFLFLTWAIGALVYYSIRDRS